jgi:hypothetical protein
MSSLTTCETRCSSERRGRFRNNAPELVGLFLLELAADTHERAEVVLVVGIPPVFDHVESFV